MKITFSQKNHIDVTILIAVLTLMLLSLGIVYSASASFGLFKHQNSEYMLTSHAAKVFLGVLCIFIFMRLDYHLIQRFSKFALLGAILLLVLTFILGGEAKGATRWLRLWGFGLQPSEFAKYALLFHLSALVATKQEYIRNFKKGFVPMMIWVGLVTLLIMIQPNFSMGAMILILSIIMLYIGNVRIKHLVLTLVAMLPLTVVFMLRAEYRLRRIVDYINGVGGDDSKPAHQIWQSIIAFGNGGIFGVGPGESKQRDFFLPEPYGDFVFSIVGEEYGFIGTLFFLAIFLWIMYRGFRIAKYAPDSFGRNMAIAITVTITMYALINAGVTLGILPTTGLPMPFVSYGGSSMVFSACAIGILLSISAHSDLHPRAREIPIVGSVNADDGDLRKVY